MQSRTTSTDKPRIAPRDRYLLSGGAFQQAVPQEGQDVVRAACLQAMATDRGTGIDEFNPCLSRRRLPRKG